MDRESIIKIYAWCQVFIGFFILFLFSLSIGVSYSSYDVGDWMFILGFIILPILALLVIGSFGLYYRKWWGTFFSVIGYIWIGAVIYSIIYFSNSFKHILI
jgi:hypothetical protein